jgi:hypothetical protein
MAGVLIDRHHDPGRQELELKDASLATVVGRLVIFGEM